MNIPMTNQNINSSPKTMSSREIAQLVESRHDKVKQSIERLVEKGIIAQPPMGDVLEIGGNNRSYKTTEYLLAKRDSYVVVAQLSPEFTARLVDRWQELESSTPTLDPKTITMTDLAKMVIKSEEEKEALQIENAALAPKATAFDRFINAEGLYGLQNAARVIGVKPNKFVGWLKQKFLFYQGGALVFYAQYRELGIFELKTTIIDDTARHRVYVTPKGIDYLRQRVPDEFMIGGAS